MGVFWVSFFAVGFILATLMYTVARKRRLMAIVDTIWTAGLGLAA
jgi:steroid 5-alpha reductase family enzyme